ncbi:MAG: hypothetical protein K2J93_03495, partial [Anaeroplasmataceae bacterium]|nr:hypothetical protein [Anaeroplasmataceae bacterium]
MRRLSILLVFLVFFLFSCQTRSTEIDPPDDPNTPIEPVEPEDPTEPKTYEKDEEGFYILEEDYFTNTSKKDNLNTSKLRYMNTLEASLTYNDMRLYAGDKRIPLYNTKVNVSQSWNAEAPHRVNNAVGIIELEGIMTFKLQCNFLIHNECKISPLQADIPYTIDESRRVITFTITQAGQYTIEFRSKRTLHLFVNEYKQYDSYKEDANVIYFGPGVHTSKNSKYISSDNYIHLKSNHTVLLDLGAVLE